MYAFFMLVAAGYMAAVSTYTAEPGCENCGCCVEKTCDSDSYCTNGCIDGIYGNKCYRKCPAHCAACSRNRNYTTNIYYIHPCTKCPDGKYLGTSEDCSATCPQDCVKCSSNSICSECKQSYFNGGSIANCSLTCPMNCLCRNRTCVSCKPGYYGVSNYCHSACPSDCSSCRSSALCNECKPGKYGVICEHRCSYGCSGESCDKNNGECTCKSPLFTGLQCNECVAGKYGNNCDQPCSISCEHNICHRSNGHCDTCKSDWFIGNFCEQCKVGLYGSFCNETCPANCEDGNCLKDNGICIMCKANFNGDKCDDCIDGWFGENCSLKCLSSKCGGNCDRLSGSCLRCQSGTYGRLCDNECSSGCINDSCEIATGNCSCENGFSGDKCDYGKKELSFPVGLMIGSVTTAILYTIILIVVYIICRKRFHGQRQAATSSIYVNDVANISGGIGRTEGVTDQYQSLQAETRLDHDEYEVINPIC